MPAAALLAVALLAPACGGAGAEEGASTTTTTTEASTTTTTAPVEAQVLADYRAAWAAFERVGEAPDPQAPELLAAYAGPALANVQQYLSELRGADMVVRGETQLDPVVRSVEGDVAVVWDCVVDHSEDYDALTGELRDEPGPATIAYEVRLTLVDGTWKTEELTTEEQACDR